MKTPEDTINRFINEENVQFNQERDDWMIEAMEEYAKGYHKSEVKKLNIFSVSKQRELLISFSNYLKVRSILNVVQENIPIRVDLFLKRNL